MAALRRRRLRENSAIEMLMAMLGSMAGAADARLCIFSILLDMFQLMFSMARSWRHCFADIEGINAALLGPLRCSLLDFHDSGFAQPTYTFLSTPLAYIATVYISELHSLLPSVSVA